MNDPQKSKDDDDEDELILRDLFFHKTGSDLFEESNVKSNLLLKNSFLGLKHHAWYQWNPDSVLLVDPTINPNNFDQTFVITIATTSKGKFDDIPKNIIAWIVKQLPNFSQVEMSSYLHLHVKFYNQVDVPKLIEFKWNRNFNYDFGFCLDSAERKQQFQMLKYNFTASKSFKEGYIPFQTDLMHKHVAKDYIERKIKPVELKLHMLTAYKKNHAQWFFKEGFYIAPSSISSSESRYGLFSLGFIKPGCLLFHFLGKQIIPDDFEKLNLETKLKLEAYVFEANFLLHDPKIAREEEKTEGNQKKKEAYIQYVFDPTNTNQEMRIKDMNMQPNCGPWMNEPPKGKISNVLIQPFTFFDIPLDRPKERYVLIVRNARVILPHEELFLHYENTYFRKSYLPGEKCPDLLT